MNTTYQNSTILKCHDCGSDLILVEVTTHTVDKNPFPITKSTYRCSNQECQEESDQKTAKRIELKKEQEKIREERKKRSNDLALSSPRR